MGKYIFSLASTLEFKVIFSVAVWPEPHAHCSANVVTVLAQEHIIFPTRLQLLEGRHCLFPLNDLFAFLLQCLCITGTHTSKINTLIKTPNLFAFCKLHKLLERVASSKKSERQRKSGRFMRECLSLIIHAGRKLLLENSALFQCYGKKFLCYCNGNVTTW